MRLILFIPLLFAFDMHGSKAASKSNIATSDQHLQQKIDNYLQRYDDFSGAVLVVKEGRIILSKGYGFANYEMHIPNTPQTRFRIASLSKPFAAIAIMQLQEKNLLKVEDTISKYLPDFPNGEKITIHHLLTHTSGIPNYYKYFADISGSTSTDEMVASFKNWPIEFEPGTQYCYSNSGYVMLAYIIEKVSGKKYANFLQENIFNPLNMKNSGHDNPAPGLQNTAVGYVESNGAIERIPPIENPTFLIGNGDLYSSAEDLYQWDRALYAEKMLNKNSIDSIFAPHVSMKSSAKRFHGYGWFVDEQCNRRVVEYSGFLRGFLSKFGRFIDDQTTIILLTNLENRDQFCRIYDDLVAMLFEEYRRASQQETLK